MIRKMLLIITLLFIHIPNIGAYEAVRVNNRIITSDWIPTVNKNISKAQAESIIHYVFKEAKRHKIDPLLLLAIIKTESTFKLNAKSTKGARGLMQVLPYWHKDKIRGRNINELAVNIEVGTIIINDCLKKHNDNVKRGLRCYLGGQSKSYVKKVATSHQELKELLVTQMFTREQPVIILSNFNNPRQYHAELEKMETNHIQLALGSGNKGI